MEIKVGIRYEVVHPSNDGTLNLGDRVSLAENGDLMDYSANGWIDAEDVSKALEGAVFEIDVAWYERRSARLREELAAIERILADGQ